MKLKKEFIFILCAISALLVYLLMRDTDRSFYNLPDIKAVEFKNIAKIEINKKDLSVNLHKKDDIWFIGKQNYTADKRVMQEILSAVKNLKLTALVSQAKNYARYDLAPDNKITVKVREKSGQLVRDFEIGKTASSFGHTFVKIAGNDNVYHASGNFRDKLDTEIDDLRDKTVFSFDPEKIIRINAVKNKKQVEIFRKDIPAKQEKEKTNIVWKDAKGKIIEAEKIKKIFTKLNGLRCDKYIYGKGKNDFTQPIYKIILSGDKERRLLIFKPDNDDYPAVSSENNYPFFISQYNADVIINTFYKSAEKK